MPRFIVERTFPGGREIPIGDPAAVGYGTVARRNRELGVTWISSYVSDDRKTSFCLYDAPTADAIRATAAANDLPVDRVTEVRILDPYSYAHEQEHRLPKIGSPPDDAPPVAT